MNIREIDAQNIADEMKRAIGRDINIMDEAGIILASTNPARKGQLHQGARILLAEGRAQLSIQEDNPSLGVQKGINLPIRINGRAEGVVGITGDPDEVSVYGKIIQRLTEIMLESINQRQIIEQMDRAKGLFLENWLFEPDPDWQEITARGRLLGFDTAAPYTVSILESRGVGEGHSLREENVRELRNQEIVSRIRDRMPGGESGYVTVIRGQVILLFLGLRREEIFQAVCRICGEMGDLYQRPFCAGISDVSNGPEDLRRCYLEACTAASVSRSGSGRTVVFYDQVSLEFVINSVPRSIRRDLATVVFAACTPEEKEEFRETILLYFRENGRIAQCAEKIFVHRNTFQYRIDRIARKTGYDLRRPRDSALLYIACLQL